MAAARLDPDNPGLLQGQRTGMDRTRITPERWQRMQDLFGRAVSLPAQERAHLLVEECGEDVSLREQVLALLLTTGGDDGDLEERVDHAVGGILPTPEIV